MNQSKLEGNAYSWRKARKTSARVSRIILSYLWFRASDWMKNLSGKSILRQSMAPFDSIFSTVKGKSLSFQVFGLVAICLILSLDQTNKTLSCFEEQPCLYHSPRSLSLRCPRLYSVHVRLSNKSIRENFETTHASLTEIDRISIVSNKRNVLFFYFPVFRHKQKTWLRSSRAQKLEIFSLHKIWLQYVQES